MRNYYRLVRGVTLAGLLALTLSACGASDATTATSAAPPVVPTAAATATPAIAPTSAAAAQFESISGTGELTSAHVATLNFLVQGRVEQVLVEEGQTVKQGDLLAILDTRLFDTTVSQAEAGLAAAKAQQTALDEKPRAADVQAARAQIQQAQIGIAQARTGQTQDVRAADAGLNATQASLQNTRDQLSLAKTIAEKQLIQATQGLTQAQARFAQAKSNWDYARDDGRDPIKPRVTSESTGKTYDNKLSDGAKEAYYAQYVQAEAALHQAEESVAQAQVQAETTRQAELTGIQAAEQQVTQAQSSVAKLRVPMAEDRVASAQANLALAQANLARLNADPNRSQRGQAAAGVASAEATLAQARLNREYAELRAPFDAVIVQATIEPGEAAGPSAQAAFELLDAAHLRFEVPIADVDIARVQLGQRAQVRLDALPDRVFDGAVTYIAAAAVTHGNARTYLVRITLDRSQGTRIGMSGGVTLALGTQGR